MFLHPTFLQFAPIRITSYAEIDFTNTKLFQVPVNQRPWPRAKRYASVNNFGFGGTNAHAVLEKAPFAKKMDNEVEAAPTPTKKLFLITANDKATLETQMKNLGIYLEQRPEMFQKDLMANLAYTLGQRRSHFQWRAAIPATTSFELIEAMSSGNVTIGKESEPLRLGFIFTGQGAQWWAMGRELYEQYPVFTASLDAADKCLAALGSEWSLVGMFHGETLFSLVFFHVRNF